MKHISALIALVAIICSTAFTPDPAHVEVFRLDKEASTLVWTGKKLTGAHTGTLKFLNGELKDNHGKLFGTFVIDMQSLANTDLDGGSKAKLENHLKSADFFDVEAHPTAKFEVTAITPLSATSEEGLTHTVTGNMTIKGNTNPLSFDAKMQWLAEKLTFAGTAVVDRSKYDVRHRSQSFFPDIGDKLIYDDFSLDFNVVFVQ